MRLVLARTMWGLEDDPARYGDRLAAVAAAGYDAVTCPVQALPDDGAFGEALEQAGLEYIPQLFTFGRTVDEHLDWFRDGLTRAARFSPRHVVAQAGRDAWDTDQAVRFLAVADRVAGDLEVRVAHETHRGRILYAPWVAERVLDALPHLRVSCDLSHWTCVAESMRLRPATLERIAGTAVHIDARVGHEEGPQVPDPRLPRYAEHLGTFESWWDVVWERRSALGDDALVVTPEFGPPPYQPIDPHSGDPLADVNELNDWMAGRLRARYGPAAAGAQQAGP